MTEPSEKDLSTFATVEQQAREYISSELITALFAGQIIELFRKAYDHDRDVFIKEIFFQNQVAIRATKGNQDYIFELFDAAKACPEGERKQIQLVNIYRNMVSDLFEPYLSIFIACLQLIDGTFKSFDIANLGAAEFNKLEFIHSRYPYPKMFQAYKSIIRNSASHTGTHGVRYEDDNISFYKIKRSPQPAIDDVLQITTTQLIGYIQGLIDFTQSVDVSIIIMGMDMGQIIINTPVLAQAFHELLVTREQLAARHEERAQNYKQIWFDDKLTFTDKIEHFRELYAEGCRKNSLPARFLRVVDNFLVIAVPWKKLGGMDLKYLVNRAAELCQYAVLAEMYFYHRFSDYLVEEISEPGEDTLQIWQNREDLKLYNQGSAHMLDLLEDGKLYKNYIYKPLKVNFETLDEQALKSLKRQRVRKKR